MIPAIIARLRIEVPGLMGRVAGLGSLAALTAQDAVPTLTPCAHVTPSFIRAPKGPSTLSGSYIQTIERGYAVFLSLRTHDPNGARVLDDAAALIDAIILAIAGWEPAPQSIGAFVFGHAVLRTLDRGVAIYEIAFSLSDQLRIST